MIDPIYTALSSLTYNGALVPVCHVPYKGNSDTYITYQVLGQDAQIYAEGAEAETCVTFAISIFAVGYSASLMLATKAALETAGYVVTVDLEYYDVDTDSSQMGLLATAVGAQYG